MFNLNLDSSADFRLSHERSRSTVLHDTYPHPTLAFVLTKMPQELVASMPSRQEASRQEALLTLAHLGQHAGRLISRARTDYRCNCGETYSMRVTRDARCGPDSTAFCS